MFVIEPPYTQTPGSTINSRENPLITIQRSKSLLLRQRKQVNKDRPLWRQVTSIHISKNEDGFCIFTSINSIIWFTILAYIYV